MTDIIHRFIEQYGLLAVFLGCVAEGESVAILAGFLAHQGVFDRWSAVAAVFAGAFLGDLGLFLAGRHFAGHSLVMRLRARAGFAQAMRLIDGHPNLFVLSNRYIYGMRAIGGVAAGLSSIGVMRFACLNVLASMIWTLVFVTLGYLLGSGAEELLGRGLAKHERLLLGLGATVLIAVIAAAYAHWRSARVDR